MRRFWLTRQFLLAGWNFRKGQALYQVLITAGAFYAFVIKRFEGKELFSPEEMER